MACKYTVNGKVLTENEFKAFLLDDGMAKLGVVEKEKSNTEKAKDLADKIRALKSKPRKITMKDENGNDIEVDITKLGFWDDMIEIAALAVEQSGKIADGVKAALIHLRKQDWYKNLPPEQQVVVDDQVKEMVEELSAEKEAPKKERGLSKTTRANEDKAEVKALLDKDPLYYREVTNEESVQKAKDFIDEYGIEEATDLALDRNVSVQDGLMANTLGLVLMDYYGQEAAKMFSGPEKTKLLNKVIALSEAVGERMSLAGQQGQVMAIWHKMTPEGALVSVEKALKRYNESPQGQKRKAKFKKAMSGYKSEQESVARKVAQSERVKKVKGEKVYSDVEKEINEQRKKEHEAIDKFVDKYFSTNTGGMTFSAFIPPTVIKGFVKTFVKAIKLGVDLKAAINKAIAYLRLEMGDADVDYDKAEKYLIDFHKKMEGAIKNYFNEKVKNDNDKKIEKLVNKVETAIKNKSKKDLDIALSELQNISKETGLWGKYKKYAVERLASINITQASSDINKSPLLKQFTDELVANIKAKIKEKMTQEEKDKVDKKDSRDILADAYKNFEKYQEVWEDTQKSFKEKFKDDTAALDILDNYYGELLKTPFNKKLISESIKASLKERNKTIDEIIKSHLTERARTKQELIDELIAKTGVSGETAKDLAAAIEEEYDKLTKGGAQKLIEKYFGKLDKKGKITEEQKAALKDKNSTINKINETLNMRGLVDDKLLMEYFGERFGVKTLSAAQTEEILKYSEAVQKTEGKFKERATQQLVQAISRIYGASALDYYWALWYPSMLSGPSTHIINITNSAGNIVSKYFENPVNVSLWLKSIKDAIKNKDPRVFMYGNPLTETILKPVYYFGPKPFKQNTKLSFNEFADIIQHGMLDDKFADKPFQSGSKVEISPLEDKRIRQIPILKWAELGKYVGRLLQAEDALLFRTAEESEFISSVRRHYVTNGLRGKELYQAVYDEIMGGNDRGAAMAQMEKEVETYESITKDKLTKMQKTIRLIEILRQSRLPEMVKEAKESAESMVYRGNYRGGIGNIAHAIALWTMKKNLPSAITKLFVPFTKVVSQVFNYSIDYTPFYGILRANGLSFTAIEKTKFFQNNFSEKFKTITPTQMGKIGEKAYYDQMGRASLGTIAFATLGYIVLSQADMDDDDPDKIIIVGNHAGLNYEQSKNVQGTYPKGSIRINGVWYPYRAISGLDVPLTILGNWMDVNRWSEGKGASERLGLAMIASKNTFLEKAFLNGLNELTNIIYDSKSGASKTANDLFKKGMEYTTKPLPQNWSLITQIDDIFSKYEYKPETINDILKYSLYNGWNLDKPKLDVFGHPIKTYPGEQVLPIQHWFNLQEEDPVWKKLADEGLTSKISKFGDLHLYDEDGNALPVDDNQQYIYKAYAGREWHRLLNLYLNDEDLMTEKLSEHDFKGIDPENLNKDAKEKIIEIAKDEAAKIAYYRIASEYGQKYNLKDLDWLKYVPEIELEDIEEE